MTGSHIKRVDVEGVSPIQTITKADMDKKGFDNLGDVVRDLGANSFGSGTVSGNSNAPGNADINLRGLGSDNTLVLLNGQRLPQDAVTGTVDINLIPMAAVERIEILKDGASAIYGSDALGGVVNIITKKDFQGTELSVTQTLPTNYGDGKKTQVSLVNGYNTEKLNVVTSVDYRYDQAIASSDRPWSNNEFSKVGNPPSYSNNQNGTDGPSMTNNCPANLLYTDAGGSYCRYEFSNYSEEAPVISQIGVMSEAHYEVNSNLRLFSRLSYNHRYVQEIAAPAPGSVEIPPGNVGQFNPPGWDGASPLDVNWRLTPLGVRETDVTTNAYGVVTGATIQLPKDWTLDATADMNIVKTSSAGVNGFALASTLQTLIDNGTVNPFAPVGSQGDLSSASYVPTEDTKTVITNVEVKAAGDIYQTAAGPISLALGSLVSYSDYYDVTDPQTLAGNVFGSSGGSGGGHRTSEAFYTELSIPIVEKKLEMQLAGRFDHYSDFGSTVNPKVGLLYHASNSLLFRSSWGTGFRAPLLSELYAGQSTGYQTFIDHVACAKNGGSDCQAQQYLVNSGGNPGLKQETSSSYTLGAIYSPTRTLDFGADWFFTKIANQPGIDYNDLTLAQEQGINTSQLGITTVRNAADEIVSINAPLQNLSETEELGVDLSGSYALKQLKFTTEQNQLLFYRTSGFPGVAETNKLGWYGQPNWRNTTSVSYALAFNQEVTETSHTIPGQLTLDKSGNLTPLTTFDISYVYRTKSIGDFSFSVINILGSTPPVDSSQPTSPVNYSLYDPNGRQVVLGYKVRI